MRTSVASRIARSTGVLTLATALSRVLGFVRDILLAHLFGTMIQAQAFVVAFRLPNLLRDLVAEGAVASALVPGLSWHRTKGDAASFWGVSQAIFSKLLVLLCAIGLLGILAAPAIVRVVAPGFVSDPEKFALTVLLTRILFPFITLVGLWAYFMGLLNTLDRFGVPALGPAILNLSMIVACVWFAPRTNPAVVAVAIGVMVGGVIQLLVQIPVALRNGFRWRWRWNYPGANDILRLLGPRMAGSAVYQANVLIDTILASLGSIVGEGAVAALYFANRLIQLPLALFGTASAQASLPSLAEQSAVGDLRGFGTTLQAVMRMVAFVILPSSAGLIVLASPIIRGLFERGAFDQHASAMTSQALLCYSFGLLAYSLNKVLTGAFYALHDTWTPVKLAVEVVVVNILVCLVLMWPLRVSGLALAASLTNSMNLYRLTHRMERRLDMPLIQPLMGPLLRMLVASVVMGGGCWVMWRIGHFAHRPLVGLPLTIVVGGAVYLAVCWLLRVKELSTVMRWLGKLPVIQLFIDE